MPSRARRTTPSRIGPRPTHLWYWRRGADDIVHLGQGPYTTEPNGGATICFTEDPDVARRWARELAAGRVPT